MHVSLDEVLALVGPLDDAPGFETPRERFRRFLVDRAGNLAELRALLEEAARGADRQHTRAGQDIVVLLGRFLGFQTSFGSYDAVAGALKFDGYWRSPQGLDAVIDVRTRELPPSPAGFDSLVRSVTALPSVPRPGAPLLRLGLAIVTPHRNRGPLDEALWCDSKYASIRLVSLRSLLWFANALDAGRLQHAEIAEVIAKAENADEVVDLMARTSAGGAKHSGADRVAALRSVG